MGVRGNVFFAPRVSIGVSDMRAEPPPADYRALHGETAASVV